MICSVVVFFLVPSWNLKSLLDLGVDNFLKIWKQSNDSLQIFFNFLSSFSKSSYNMCYIIWYCTICKWGSVHLYCFLLPFLLFLILLLGFFLLLLLGYMCCVAVNMLKVTGILSAWTTLFSNPSCVFFSFSIFDFSSLKVLDFLFISSMPSLYLYFNLNLLSPF